MLVEGGAPEDGRSGGAVAVGCEVYYSSLNNDPDALSWLTREEQQRYNAFRSIEARDQFVAGRGLARRVIGSRLGLHPESVRFVARCNTCGKEHGRPSLLGSEIDFSISHSGDMVALALLKSADSGAGRAVGIDVEAFGGHDIASLASVALTEAERNAMFSLAQADQQRCFLQYWTRKEALLKAAGVGLTVNVGRIDVGLCADSGPHYMWGDGRVATLVDLPMRADSAKRNMVGAVCVLARHPTRVTVTVKDLDCRS